MCLNAANVCAGPITDCSFYWFKSRGQMFHFTCTFCNLCFFPCFKHQILGNQDIVLSCNSCTTWQFHFRVDLFTYRIIHIWLQTMQYLPLMPDCSTACPVVCLYQHTYWRTSNNVCWQVFSAAMEEMRVSLIIDPPNYLLVSGWQLEHPYTAYFKGNRLMERVMDKETERKKGVEEQK